MNKKVGFIGCGKMAQSIIKGIISSKQISYDQIKVSAKSMATLNAVKEKYSILTTTSNMEVAAWSDILFIAVEPNIHSEVIEEIKNELKNGSIIITVAAGISLHSLEKQVGRRVKAVRSMPNTPSFVGEGMSVISINDKVNSEELEEVKAIFGSFGKVEVIEEQLMDSIPAISGSSPAYVFMLIEALADGGVKNGLPRELAYCLASQAVLGAAKMVLETGIHPGELKDQVCTPGGSTIEAVSALEEHGFRSAILKAMEKCTAKSQSISYLSN